MDSANVKTIRVDLPTIAEIDKRAQLEVRSRDAMARLLLRDGLHARSKVPVETASWDGDA